MAVFRLHRHMYPFFSSAYRASAFYLTDDICTLLCAEILKVWIWCHFDVLQKTVQKSLQLALGKTETLRSCS
jgi:hypothetical protein